MAASIFLMIFFKDFFVVKVVLKEIILQVCMFC